MAVFVGDRYVGGVTLEEVWDAEMEHGGDLRDLPAYQTENLAPCYEKERDALLAPHDGRYMVRIGDMVDIIDGAPDTKSKTGVAIHARGRVYGSGPYSSQFMLEWPDGTYGEVPAEYIAQVVEAKGEWSSAANDQKEFEDVQKQLCLKRGYYYYGGVKNCQATPPNLRLGYDWGLEGNQVYIKYLDADDAGEIKEGYIEMPVTGFCGVRSYESYIEKNGSDKGYRFGDETGDHLDLYECLDVADFGLKNNIEITFIGWSEKRARELFIDYMRKVSLGSCGTAAL